MGETVEGDEMKKMLGSMHLREKALKLDCALGPLISSNVILDVLELDNQIFHNYKCLVIHYPFPKSWKIHAVHLIFKNFSNLKHRPLLAYFCSNLRIAPQKLFSIVWFDTRANLHNIIKLYSV